jgi:(1->4)-alpha-D-glucan 1-alpha-D-glucosylmutase
VRARLNVLSEIPAEWEKRLLLWRRQNQRHKTTVNRIPVPTPGEEVLIYQTLLGAWPLDRAGDESFRNRVQQFLTKAVREAKTYSGWIQQDEAHESAVTRFAQKVMAPEPTPFRRDFLKFQRKLAWHGALNSLSQVLIKITAPGVPDFYQGTELWDLSLVDPDNRRPVDFNKRVRLLEELRKSYGERLEGLLKDLIANWKDGRIKLFLTDKALDYRRVHAEVYLRGAYTSLEPDGPKRRNLCAFARHAESRWCVTVAPRWTTQLAPVGQPPVGRTVWADTHVLLPPDSPDIWSNVLTGEALKASPAGDGWKGLCLGEVLKRFPVALLDGPTA